MDVDAAGSLNWERPQRVAFGGKEGEARANAPAWCAPVEVRFAVDGAAELAAVGSGDPIDPSGFGGPARRTYRGRATAIVRPLGGKSGKVVVRASAYGLVGAEVELEVK